MSQDGNEQYGREQKSSVPVWFMTTVTIPILVAILWFGRDFFVPIALATLLFILTMALIDRLDAVTIRGTRVPRPLAYTAALILVIGLLVGFGYSISNQAAAMAEVGPRYNERLIELKGQLDTLIGAERVAAVERAIEDINLQGFLSELAASAAGMIGNVALIVLYLVFMVAERGAFAEKLPRLCKTKEQALKINDIIKSISVGVRQYMWINAVTSAMSATLSFVVLKFLGVDFALTLALTVFLLNFIPNIGSFLAVVIQVAVALLQFDTLTPALIIVAVYGGGDAIIGNVVQPRMQGKSLNLSTFVVMLALSFWGMLWGGVGAFVAVPLTVVIMIACSQIPGLQPFARLLSSDGVLPGEQPSSSVGDSHPRQGQPRTEIETELADMKKELLAQKSSRQTGPKGEI